MGETPLERGSNLDHVRLVKRHHNIFETNARPTGNDTTDISTKGSNQTGPDSERSIRKIVSGKGLPCILGAQCRCICPHVHIAYRDDTDYGEATVQNEDYHNYCPVHSS